MKKGNPYFAASTSYVAPRGDVGDPNAGGIMNDASGGSFTTQIGLAAKQWALTAAWRYGQCGENMTRRGTQFARQSLDCSWTAGNALNDGGAAYSNNFALTGAWQPAKGGTWIPSISVGWASAPLLRLTTLSIPATATRTTSARPSPGRWASSGPMPSSRATPPGWSWVSPPSSPA